MTACTEEIINTINRMSGKYSPDIIFSDWMECTAISIQNACCMFHNAVWHDREQQYTDVIGKYSDGEQEEFGRLLVLLVEALEEEMTDVLGETFMGLGTGNRQEKIQKKSFTEMDIEKIRNACRSARETAIVELFLSTGCRVAELVGIRTAELQGERLTVHGKGEKDRTVYLNAKAQISLERYLAERKDKSPWLFPRRKPVTDAHITGDPGLWYTDPRFVEQDKHAEVNTVGHMMRAVGKRAGVENCHPHRFRRTCATMALRRGMPIEQVSRMLGHEQLGTTQIYLDLTEEELQQAHRKYVV